MHQDNPPESGTLNNRARNLSLLLLILMALHVFWGLTAIMAVLIAHVKLASTRDTIYHSHLIWHIKTFWAGFCGYAVAIWAWSTHDLQWPVLAMFAFIAYRLAVHLRHWMTYQSISRIV